MSYNINDLLKKMIELDSSDLFLTVDAVPKALIYGNLTDIGSELLTEEDTKALARQVCSDAQWEDFLTSRELNLAYSIGRQRWRLNLYFQRGNIALVARVIRTKIPTLDSLNMPSVFKELVMAKRGILLITGATGSGKSTTLAALIEHRNSNSTGHIITVEDPIEFVHTHKNCIISQREVGSDTLSYETALKNALRETPNVILIGEIRDMETANFALHASDTGHLVLGTLHTNNANQTIERLINLFPPEQKSSLLYQLANNIVGIISQRLVPTTDGKRVAAIEILVNTPRIQELILDAKFDELKITMYKGASVGMQTFDQSLYSLQKTGQISEDTAIKHADSPNDLKLRLRGIGN